MIASILIASALAGTTPPTSGGRSAISDCDSCPQMIVLDSGTAMIGSPAEEPGRYANEELQQPVAIKPFAIGKTEVTRRQFADFLRSTRYSPEPGCFVPGDLEDWVSDLNPDASWENPGFEQSDNHPVVCVSWTDAAAYAKWLSGLTGHRYRLPTEVEWELAARAGTLTAYFWGNDIQDGCKFMNGGDQSLANGLPKFARKTREYFDTGVSKSVIVPCDDGHVFTAQVASFPANRFGLFDVIGNAWEWVEDCGDTPPPTGGECRMRRTRGGSWDDWPVDLRSSVKKRLEPAARRNDVGFRLVREMEDSER